MPGRKAAGRGQTGLSACPRTSSRHRAVFFDAVGTLLFPDPLRPCLRARSRARTGWTSRLDEVRTRFLQPTVRKRRRPAAGWVTARRAKRRAGGASSPRRLRCAGPRGLFPRLFDHFAPRVARRTRMRRCLRQLRDRGIRWVSARTTTPGSVGARRLAGTRSAGDRVVVSAAVGYRKPAAEFFREVVRVAGCEPREVLFVGDDMENDYEGATAAGCGRAARPTGDTAWHEPDSRRR